MEASWRTLPGPGPAALSQQLDSSSVAWRGLSHLCTNLRMNILFSQSLSNCWQGCGHLPLKKPPLFPHRPCCLCTQQSNVTWQVFILMWVAIKKKIILSIFFPVSLWMLQLDILSRRQSCVLLNWPLVALSCEFIKLHNKCQQMFSLNVLKNVGLKKDTTAKKGLKMNYEAIVKRDMSWRLLFFPLQTAFHFLTSSCFPYFLRKPPWFHGSWKTKPFRACPSGSWPSLPLSDLVTLGFTKPATWPADPSVEWGQGGMGQTHRPSTLIT